MHPSLLYILRAPQHLLLHTARQLEPLPQTTSCRRLLRNWRKNKHVQGQQKNLTFVSLKIRYLEWLQQRGRQSGWAERYTAIMPGTIPLSASELNALVITERVNSCLSMAGIFFVLITYTFSSHFDKPINRLIFFATWGNIGSTVASLISDAGPLAVVGHKTAPLCQLQGFLVQSK